MCKDHTHFLAILKQQPDGWGTSVALYCGKLRGRPTRHLLQLIHALPALSKGLGDLYLITREARIWLLG